MTTTLYRFYDPAGHLLYIGVAGNPGRRFEQHANEKPWWNDIAHSTLTHFATRTEALNAERNAITTERPQHNVTHNNALYSECEWLCDICRQVIGDGDGYLDLNRRDEWAFLHRRCDPHPNTSRYWIGVEQIRTYAAVNDWVDHLSKKQWFRFDRWAGALYHSSKETP